MPVSSGVSSAASHCDRLAISGPRSATVPVRIAVCVAAPERKSNLRKHVQFVPKGVGDVQRAQYDLLEALLSYGDSQMIQERLAKSDLSNADWQRGLSISLMRVGSVLESQGKLSEALKSYDNSHTIMYLLAKSNPNQKWFEEPTAEEMHSQQQKFALGCLSPSSGRASRPWIDPPTEPSRYRGANRVLSRCRY